MTASDELLVALAGMALAACPGVAYVHTVGDVRCRGGFLGSVKCSVCAPVRAALERLESEPVK